MHYNMVRQLMIDDKIARAKTGVSPIRLEKTKTKTYLYTSLLFKISSLSSLVSLYFAYSKRLSGRSVYQLSTTGLVLVALCSKYYSNYIKNELETKWKTKSEEEFQEMVSFYSRIYLNTEKEDKYFNSLRH